MKGKTDYLFAQLLRKYNKLTNRYFNKTNVKKFELLSPAKKHRLIRLLNRLVRQLNEVLVCNFRLQHMALAAGLMLFIPGFAQMKYVEKTGANNPMSAHTFNGWTHPELADVDGDGDLDMFVGDNAQINHFENTGSPSNPQFITGNLSKNTLNGGAINIEFVDSDGDGDQDLVVSDQDFGVDVYEFENVGTATSANFQTPTGPKALYSSHCGDAQPFFADLDGDGNLDYFLGGKGIWGFYYWNNKGTNANPSYKPSVQLQLNLTEWASGDFGDIDRDGDLDLVVGLMDGRILYYENRGTAIKHDFYQQILLADPFDQIDVGERATPVLVDVDNDGYLEAFVGSKNGDVRLFDNNLVGLDEHAANQISFKQLNKKLYINADESVELEGLSVSVYDVLGKEMMVEITSNQDVIVDLVHLKPGIYLGVVTNERIKESVKILVE